MEKQLKVFIVSDSVGETGEHVAKAAISQFRPMLQDVDFRKFAHIYTMEHIHHIVKLAQQQQAIIIYTLVHEKMRQYMHEEAEKAALDAIDVLGPIISTVGKTLDEKPAEEPGLVYQLDDGYFKKIEAIEFAVKYDDGKDPRGILKADIVLVGVSRTSKTPLSQYLAHKKIKVANIPLVPEVEPPEELYMVDPKKCFGLVISSEKLHSIRKERLLALGLRDDAIYATDNRIESEIAHFYHVVDRIGCDVIDVTNKAVEETANDILQRLKLI
ncbi:pyruvate, water dikinase regulatory protein [Caryophanon tenue]|uniref:Putative pyruvate, phosphate dikinase regulatory protein n=1 Tax=Caryophanon tenue TaxID=33978 RepID=A0A1C0YN19_9BACL|nr:pyruvate, water dikinase regulatory protein [Caryophanon tenue]OCS88543.1 phosphoenolpyruvate synthase regulatory protein [Caryophanon tenue]